MSGIVSDSRNPNYTTGGFSTANGFWRVEAGAPYLISSGQTTTPANAGLDIALQFNNACNIKGLQLSYQTGGTTSVGSIKDTTAELHELKTMTITIASPGVVTSTGHGLSAGQAIRFATTGALPTGITMLTGSHLPASPAITISQTYYVIATGLTADTFQFSATLGGSAVNTSGTQSGTHTLRVVRTSETVAFSTILGSSTTGGGNIQYGIKFTNTYAVDTTASKWMMWVAGTGANTTHPTFMNKSATASDIQYIVWGDNQVSNRTSLRKDVLMSIASPAVVTCVAHGLSANDPIMFQTGTNVSLPSGPLSNNVYYVLATGLTADTFQFSSSVGGAAVNTTGTLASSNRTTGNDTAQGGYYLLYNKPVTVTIASPGVFTLNSHGLVVGDVVSFYTTGALPTGLTAGTNYFVISAGLAANTFQVSATPNGTAVNTSGTQSGTHFVWYGDYFVAVDDIIIDTNVNIRPHYDNTSGASTGGIICRGSGNTKDTVSRLKWASSPSASYVFACYGNIFHMSYAGFQVGSSTSPIPYAQRAVILTNHLIGFTASPGYSPSHLGKMNFQMYGSYPTYMRTTLASQASPSQANITTTDTTGWGVGDIISVGYRDGIVSAMDQTYYIQSISGTSITFNKNLPATNNFLSGAPVINVSRYGIAFGTLGQGGGATNYWWNPNYFKMSGVWVESHQSSPQGYEYNYDSSVIRDKIEIKNCAFRSTATTGGSFWANNPHPFGNEIWDNVGSWCQIVNGISGLPVSYAPSGMSSVKRNISFKRNVVIGFYQAVFSNSLASQTYDVQDNIFSNSVYIGSTVMILKGIGSTFKNNRFFGMLGNESSAYYTLDIQQLIDPVEISGNYIDRCTNAFGISPYITRNVVIKNNLIGTVGAVTSPLWGFTDALADIQFESNTGSLLPTNAQAALMLPGSEVRVVDDNDVSGADYVYKTYGTLTRCGYGHTDTTTHITNGESLRFESTSSSVSLVHSLNGGRGFTIGNCQNKELTFIVWIKINSANYWSGTNAMPVVTINYDNGSYAYGYAGQTTDWQRVPITFTPSTTFGSVFIDWSTITDQTGSNAYVYFADYDLQLPSGVQVFPGDMSSWSNAKPADGLSTNVTEKGVSDAVWDDQTSAHNVSGSFAKLVKLIKNVLVSQ